MKQIIQINDALKAKYKVVDADNAIWKMYFDGQTKSNKMGIFLENGEIKPFYPDQDYDIQVCHYLTGGRSNNDSKYAEMDFTRKYSKQTWNLDYVCLKHQSTELITFLNELK